MTEGNAKCGLNTMMECLNFFVFFTVFDWTKRSTLYFHSKMELRIWLSRSQEKTGSTNNIHIIHTARSTMSKHWKSNNNTKHHQTTNTLQKMGKKFNWRRRIPRNVLLQSSTSSSTNLPSLTLTDSCGLQQQPCQKNLPIHARPLQFNCTTLLNHLSIIQNSLTHCPSNTNVPTESNNETMWWWERWRNWRKAHKSLCCACRCLRTILSVVRITILIVRLPIPTTTYQ